MPVAPAVLKQLAKPTPSEEIKQREGPHGRMLDYIDARYVYDLLDREVGPENWQDRYEPAAGFTGAVRAGIGIHIEVPATKDRPGYNEWVWKWDVGEASDIEPTKGAHSEAIKRAAVHWGIARDLYAREPQPQPGGRRNADPYGEMNDPRAVPVQSQRPPVQQRAAQPQVQTAGQPQQSPWLCPVHGTFKVVPGGTSKAGKPYDAFIACTERSCNNTARGIAVPAWMLAPRQRPAPLNDHADGYGDDLPF